VGLTAAIEAMRGKAGKGGEKEITKMKAGQGEGWREI
jgi:hypothetical protein